MTICGHNDFYDGWLNRVLLQPDQPSATEAWRDGWRMANETGDAAIIVLQREIELGHIRIS